MSDMKQNENVANIDEKKFKSLIEQVDKLKQDIAEMREAEIEIQSAQQTIIDLLRAIKDADGK